MLYVRDHEEKLVKFYRSFPSETREKILALMETESKNLKRNKPRNKPLSVGERIIKSLEAYLQGDYEVVNRKNLERYFAAK